MRNQGSHHHHEYDINSRNIFISIILNGLITIVEFAGGIFSNSLALLSDAIHNLNDTLAIILSYLAFIAGRKKSTFKNTFGNKRFEILVAFVNSIVLIVISLYLFFEAYRRFINPESIKTGLMFVVALTGFFANLIAILLLRKDSKHNLNIKSAYLHLLGDTFSSVAVIIGALVLYFFKISWIDPLLTVIIGLFIIYQTIEVLRETIEILMQATPDFIDNVEIKAELEKNPAVKNIHHIHTWRLNDTRIHFECHADVKDNLVISEVDKLRAELEEVLISKFHINHITIQMEYNLCSDKDLIHHDSHIHND